MIFNKLTLICGKDIDDVGLNLYHLLSQYQPSLKEDLSFYPREEVNILINLNQYNQLSFLNQSLSLPFNHPFSSLEGVYKDVEFVIRKLNDDYLSLFFSNPNLLNEEDLYFFFKDELEQVLNLLFNYQDNVVYIDSNTLIRKDYFPSNYLHDSPLLEEYNHSLGKIKVLNNLTYYLNHLIQPNDFLILQYPERDLHPESLRLLTRFIVRLVNKKVRVLMVTHNDYLVKELNILIMGDDKPHILFDLGLGYKKDELIHMNQVNAYDLIDSLLVPADVDEDGVEIKAMDKEISEMNEVCDALLWSE